MHAQGPSLLELARRHLRREREAPDVAERVPRRPTRARGLAHVHVELLGGAPLTRDRARTHQRLGHGPDVEVPGAKRKQRPAPHELHDPRLAAGRRVARELRVLVLAEERVLHEVGHLRVAGVLGDRDVGRLDVEVLVDAEGHLLAHDGVRLVDRGVEEVDRAARRLDGQLRIGGRGRGRRLRLIEGIHPGDQRLPRIEGRERPERALRRRRLARRAARRPPRRHHADLHGLGREPRAPDRDARRSEAERSDVLRLEGPVDGQRVPVGAVAVDADVRLRRRLVLTAHGEPRCRADPGIGGHLVGAGDGHLEAHDVAHADGVLFERELDLGRALRERR